MIINQANSNDLEELKKIRAYLQRLGFNVDEITEYLRDLEQAEQPDLFPGPIFDQ